MKVNEKLLNAVKVINKECFSYLITRYVKKYVFIFFYFY